MAETPIFTFVFKTLWFTVMGTRLDTERNNRIDSMALRMETIAEICALVDGRIYYSSHFISTPSTIATPHCGNFTSNFLITITNAGSSFQHFCKKSNPGFCPEFAARFSFSLLTGRIFDLATIASCDHFSALGTGAAEFLPSSLHNNCIKNMQPQLQQ